MGAHLFGEEFAFIIQWKNVSKLHLIWLEHKTNMAMMACLTQMVYFKYEF